MKRTEYKAIDVARHIVNYTNEQGKTVSNLKLQKLLYFVQGFFLALLDRPCFSDEIEAWDFGPVVPVVHRNFKEFGSNSIPKVTTVYDCEKETFIEYIDSIDELDKRLINAITDNMSKYSATRLVEITHNQAPWKKVYKPYMNNIISTDSIKECFEEFVNE